MKNDIISGLLFGLLAEREDKQKYELLEIVQMACGTIRIIIKPIEEKKAGE